MTAVEWLVEQICVDVPMYNDDGNETNIEYWNAYKSSFDLSNFINKAKEMEKQQNKFTNSPIHDKKAIIKMMDELNPKEMSEVIDFIKLKLEIK